MPTLADQLTIEQREQLGVKSTDEALQQSFQARAESQEIGGGPSYLWFRCAAEKDGISEWWSPQRDRDLRRFVKAEGNEILAGAVASLVKKFKAMNWIIEGPESTVARMQPIVADESEFGQGWSTLVSKTVEDYLTQDVGGLWELIGKGDPDKGLDELPTGVAHLDAGKVQLTGDSTYPVLFWSTKSGKAHKIHATRVVKMTDMVSPNEDMHDVGYCSVSRTVASSRILLKLARLKDQKMSDLPPVGLLILNNILPQRWEEAQRVYNAERRRLGEDLWASVMTLVGLDPAQPASANFVSFAQLPENFNELQATEIYVNTVALAFGIDIREIWPMSAGSLGSSAHEILIQHQKAKGKGIGDLLSTLERAVNWHLLPKRCNFRFDFADDEEDAARAEIESQIVKTIMSMWKPDPEAGTPVTALEIRQMLADQTAYFVQEFLEVDLTDVTEGSDTEQEVKMYGPVVAYDRFGNRKPIQRRLGEKVRREVERRVMDENRRFSFKGGPGSGHHGHAGRLGQVGGSTLSSTSGLMPSRNNVLPDEVYQVAPGAFENVTYGAQTTTHVPYGMLDTISNPWVDDTMNPYDAMDEFGRVYWQEPRKMERVLGDTPINRFIIKSQEGAVLHYELLLSQNPDSYGIWYVVEAPTKFGRGRGKNKVPFWSDLEIEKAAKSEKVQPTNVARKAMGLALENYRDGMIEAGQLAEFALLEMADAS